MTRQRSFKERIRARMAKTGESYAAARRRLIEKAEADALEQRTPKTIKRIRKNENSVIESTGRGWDDWFELLDKWGAKGKKHGDIVRWLMDKHDVDGWWAQSVTGAYEQERGMRAPGQRADGTYSVSASKTIDVSVKALFKAFADESIRSDWLGDPDIEIRTVRPNKSLTARWEGGPSRLTVSFEPKGPKKSQIALGHERIPDAQQADELKAFWRERLGFLKKVLEG